MRVLVCWENEAERDDAENLANVLVSLAPSLAADGQLDRDGNLTIRHGSGVRPKVLVRAASWASHFDQLMRSLLDA